MALSTIEQIKQQIQKSKNILIALPERPSVDAIVSALALRSYLDKKDKYTLIVCHGFTAPHKLSFIDGVESIKTSVGATKQTIVGIDVDKHPMDDIRYAVQDNKLRIFLTPQKGDLPQDAIAIEKNNHMFDMVIVLNAAELASLGSLHHQNKGLFFELPIINIDHRPDNEHYAQIDWVDINATSTSEMIYKGLFEEKIDDTNLATALLAGMMDETHAFRSHQMHPQALELVSKLVNQGANHETIVNHLYRTKTVGLLKLWGHVLDNLESDQTLSLAWSLVPASVFKKTGTGQQQLGDLMNEILNHSSEAKTVVLIVEDMQNEKNIEIEVSTKPPLHAKDLIKDLQPIGGERIATTKLHNTSLKQAEERVISMVKKRLKQAN